MIICSDHEHLLDSYITYRHECIYSAMPTGYYLQQYAYVLSALSAEI